MDDYSADFLVLTAPPEDVERNISSADLACRRVTLREAIHQPCRIPHGHPPQPFTDELGTELFVEVPNIVDTVSARNVEMSARDLSAVVGAEPLEQKPQRTSGRLE